MPGVVSSPPYSRIDCVTEHLHGTVVSDSYRWLEEQDSPETRTWLLSQSKYTRSYLDSIRMREEVRARVQQLLSIESYDSLLFAGERYIFRKRGPHQEQAGIYQKIGLYGEDQLLLDPSNFGEDQYTSIRPLRVSPDGRLLLFEIKQGGERSGRFRLLDTNSRQLLPEVLPRGYLRGFAFSSDCKRFYYSHEGSPRSNSTDNCVRMHVLGTDITNDETIFSAGKGNNIRVHLAGEDGRLGFVVHRFLEKTYTDFYLWNVASRAPELWLENAQFRFGPLLHPSGRILAITDYNAPNYRIVEVRYSPNGTAIFEDVIEETHSPIQDWVVGRNLMCVSYLRGTSTSIEIFDLNGKSVRNLPVANDETVRLTAVSPYSDDFFLERESFTVPTEICRVSGGGQTQVWSKRRVPMDSADYCHKQVWFNAKDGVAVPMFLVGRREVMEKGPRPTIMTAYGGYGVAMTPQFSVFVTYLMERGCLFALPNIRGGLEFGVEWHAAAKRRKRQVAFDDFFSAAEWLIKDGRTEAGRLGIFGGSNSGLLVAVALTQRPDLFRAVLCMVPMLDMLRYHLFDNAHCWKDEFGTSEDPEDFGVLASYSPYHNVRDGQHYPATMIVSGDADQNCNPLHARKMTARLQAANASGHPILLDYRPFRGHSPALPLSVRVDALTDRLSFLCEELGLE